MCSLSREIQWEEIKTSLATSSQFQVYQDVKTCCDGGYGTYCPIGGNVSNTEETCLLNEQKCRDFMDTACTEGVDDKGKPLIYNETLCTTWCQENQTSCTTHLKKVCLPDVDWKTGGTVTINKEKSCYCHHPAFIYDRMAQVIADKYKIQIESLGAGGECLYRPCQTSAFRDRAKEKACPNSNFATCIQNSSIDNSGILDTDSLAISQSCEINFGAADEEGADEETGCTTNTDCPTGQECVGKKCVDKTSENNESKTDSTLTYIIIGGVAVVVIVALILFSGGGKKENPED